MNQTNTRTLATGAILVTIAVVGSLFSFPILGAKCSPVQSLVNIITAILLGPGWAFKVAFLAATIRNLLGLGTLFAFPGSIFGAALAGYLYKYNKNVIGAYVGELFGTSIIGSIASYPVATLILGSSKATLFGFIFPFFVSTAGGTVLAIVIVTAMRKNRNALGNWIYEKLNYHS